VRRFRFGYQLPDRVFGDLLTHARSVEAAGFDVLHSSDHVGPGPAPLAPLVAIAGATSRLRICPLVLNNDFHHPVHLARELAAIDHLSGGRLEVGLGAGHAHPEYAAIGAPFDPPAVRKARLMEAVQILRRLLDGEEVSFAGQYYELDHVQTMRSHQEHLPILVGVNGKEALARAAQVADVIGLTMLGRTLPDGQHHEVRWQPERLDAVVSHLRTAAGPRLDQLEFNVLVQAVVITEDRRAAAHELADQVPGLSVDDALAAPFLALGTHDEIARHLQHCRTRWGISYFSVRDYAAFAPIIEQLRHEDADRRPV
jgi:probable F420-dependent oxidoreductase